MGRLSMLRIALGPSSQKTVTNSLMSSTSALARKHPLVRLHTHLAENQVPGWGWRWPLRTLR
jgi:cytosine/adenosine deaminase-related metal-dependent hydrolase